MVPKSFSEQCPNRGPALTHMRDTKMYPDGRCIHCGFNPTYQVCRGFACIKTVVGDYCEDCVEKRAQHAFSHKAEGHPTPIRMCPPCEEGHD